jgi:hypothetical protein
MSSFKTKLKVRLKDDDKTWVLLSVLVYDSDLIGEIVIYENFETDFASVPRIPIFYRLYGDRAHRESIVHDYLYRIDSLPVVSFKIANRVFLEAMKCRRKSRFIRWGMYAGVCLGGWASYHKKKVGDVL